MKTCQKCHPGANEEFTKYVAHATIKDAKTNPPLFWAFWAMTALLLMDLAVDGLHTLLWYRRLAKDKKAKKNGGSK